MGALMTTPRLSPYDKAFKKAMRSYFAWRFDGPDDSALEARAGLHLTRLRAFDYPLRWGECTCEACFPWTDCGPSTPPMPRPN